MKGMDMVPRLVSVFLLPCALLFASPADAAEYLARITRITLGDAANIVYLHIEGGTPQKPACSNGTLSFSMNRARAKEYLAAVMMAFALGKLVDFATHGACIDISDSDTITHFRVNTEQ